MAIPQHDDPVAADRRQREREFEWVMALLLAGKDVKNGLPVSDLTHSCQTAARAEADGAPEELVLAALLHDVGKSLSETNHPAVAAEMLRGRVSEDIYWILKTHGDFQESMNHFNPYLIEARYGLKGWLSDAERIAVWDHASFDPEYPTPGLEHFMPALRRLYGLESQV